MLKAIDALYFVYYAQMDIPFFTYANYILFFPTFTAGPIFRYRDWLKVYTNPKKLVFEDFIGYVKRFIKGMFKKMVLLWFVSSLFSLILVFSKDRSLSKNFCSIPFLKPSILFFPYTTLPKFLSSTFY